MAFDAAQGVHFDVTASLGIDLENAEIPTIIAKDPQQQSSVREENKKKEYGANRASLWTEEASLRLIHLYSEYQDFFSNPDYAKKAVWESLAERMKLEGFSFTGEQLNNKWKRLCKAFRDTVDFNERCAIVLRKKCPFYDELALLCDYTSPYSIKKAKVFDFNLTGGPTCTQGSLAILCDEEFSTKHSVTPSEHNKQTQRNSLLPVLSPHQNPTLGNSVPLTLNSVQPSNNAIPFTPNNTQTFVNSITLPSDNTQLSGNSFSLTPNNTQTSWLTHQHSSPMTTSNTTQSFSHVIAPNHTSSTSFQHMNSTNLPTQATFPTHVMTPQPSSSIYTEPNTTILQYRRPCPVHSITVSNQVSRMPQAPISTNLSVKQTSSTFLPNQLSSSTTSVNQSSTALPVNQPSTTMPVNQPSTTMPVNQPSTTLAVNQPSAALPVNQSSTTLPIKQLLTTVLDKQSLLTRPVIEPSSTSQRKQPINISYAVPKRRRILPKIFLSASGDTIQRLLPLPKNSVCAARNRTMQVSPDNTASYTLNSLATHILNTQITRPDWTSALEEHPHLTLKAVENQVSKVPLNKGNCVTHTHEQSVLYGGEQRPTNSVSLQSPNSLQLTQHINENNSQINHSAQEKTIQQEKFQEEGAMDLQERCQNKAQERGHENLQEKRSEILPEKKKEKLEIRKVNKRRHEEKMSVLQNILQELRELRTTVSNVSNKPVSTHSSSTSLSDCEAQQRIDICAVNAIDTGAESEAFPSLSLSLDLPFEQEYRDVQQSSTELQYESFEHVLTFAEEVSDHIPDFLEEVAASENNGFYQRMERHNNHGNNLEYSQHMPGSIKDEYVLDSYPPIFKQNIEPHSGARFNVLSSSTVFNQTDTAMCQDLGHCAPETDDSSQLHLEHSDDLLNACSFRY